MLILDKTRALDRMVAQSTPEPDAEPLPDVFRIFAGGELPASPGPVLDQYAGFADLIAVAELELVGGTAGYQARAG